MEKICRLSILFLFMLFLAAPIFAQEEAEETTVGEEEVLLEEMADEGVIIGDVTALDVEAGIITVKTPGGIENTFSVVTEETILWKGIDDIELSDIKVGEEAEVGYYTDEEGKLIASWVDILIEEEIIPLLELEEKPEIKAEETFEE